MVSFYPGPSRVEERIPRYVRDAYNAGILSINHRSEEFMQLAQNTVHALKSKLTIPNDYSVFFTSSATECWEIIAQSLINGGSYHFYSGAFGEKWFTYTQKLKPTAIGYGFDLNKKLNTAELDLSAKEGTICITQNETSNGTQIHNKQIKKLRERYPNHVIAVDATSSMAGIELDFDNADVWYASVQKCFGLPAGLAVMVCSPKAIQRAKFLDETRHYNSLLSIVNMMGRNQTTHTPNVLGIYLLNRIMAERRTIDSVGRKTRRRYIEIMEVLDQIGLHHLVVNEDVRSHTVIPVTADASIVKEIKVRSRKEGIILGNGYGKWKENTFRIANFPAIKNREIKLLKEFLLSLEINK